MAHLFLMQRCTTAVVLPREGCMQSLAAAAFRGTKVRHPKHRHYASTHFHSSGNRRYGGTPTTDLSTNGSSPVLSPVPWPPLPPQSHADSSAVPFPPPPPKPCEGQPIWTDEVWASPLDLKRRIFCNRSLNMRSIAAVGFDMDYTLASYKPETFETLAHDETVRKLVTCFGYPKSLYDLTFDWRYMTRGLVIDKKRGNILKVDRHKYVKLAFHGFRSLSREERMVTYNESDQRHEFDEPEYALIDTLFSLAEAHLFMQLVEMADTQPCELPPGKTYADLYRDVRGAVDLCHRDGSIKREVARVPEKYIYSDPGLVTVLQMLHQAGKKVFLATNSLWDYTSVVMNYVLSGKVGSQRDDEWLRHFDVVITGCGKPRFFTDRKDLFEVHPSTGMLWNTEGGSPMVPIGEADLPSPELGSTAPICVDQCGITDEDGQRQRARVFQGGSYWDLHKMLGVVAGSEILFVGDHIYGDVLRSKKALGWRTMLVIPELESELETLKKRAGDMTELRVLRQQRDALEDQIQRLEWRLGGEFSDDDDNYDDNYDNNDEDDQAQEQGESGSRNDVVDLLLNLREQRDALKMRHRSLLQQHHETFHPIWGQLFKTGYQNSRYAHQIERFACLYTSHVSNLMFYSPLKSYRGRVDSMAHEDEFGAT